MCFVHNVYKLYLNVFSGYIYYTVYNTIKKKKLYNIKFNQSNGKLCVEICKFAKIRKKKTFKVLILLDISIL